jgi:hypothetical protein
VTDENVERRVNRIGGALVVLAGVGLSYGFWFIAGEVGEVGVRSLVLLFLFPLIYTVPLLMAGYGLLRIAEKGPAFGLVLVMVLAALLEPVVHGGDHESFLLLLVVPLSIPFFLIVVGLTLMLQPGEHLPAGPRFLSSCRDMRFLGAVAIVVVVIFLLGRVGG